MQAVAGYSCPSVLDINAKIAKNDVMRFPLAEGDGHAGGEIFFRYRGDTNKIEKFYDGNSHVEKFVRAYYHPQTQEVPASFTCIYKQKNSRYLLLQMGKRVAGRVKEETIGNDVNSNWQPLRDTGFYVCGDDKMAKADDCQFDVRPRYK
ncbi:MAG: hypothetical protein RJA83_802 [Pseudomonadota bacterium]